MKLTATEVCYMVGISIYTLNNWYKFKEQNPENKYAQMLPDFQSSGPRCTRYWDSSDVGKMIEFRASIPHGKVGIMGSVTQRYIKKGEINGKKKSRRTKNTSNVNS